MTDVEQAWGMGGLIPPVREGLCFKLSFSPLLFRSLALCE